MEIFGGQKVQLKPKWRSDFNKQLKRDKAKEKRGFLKSRKLWRAEEKEKWQWGAPNITALLLVGTCGCSPRSCWEVTACPDSYCESVQDTAERVEPELSKAIISVCNRSYVNTGRKGQLMHTTSSSAAGRCTPGTKECLHPEAVTQVYTEGILGSAWEGRCVHSLEPDSHKELGVRLLITFGNSQTRFAQTQWRRTTRK